MTAHKQDRKKQSHRQAGAPVLPKPLTEPIQTPKIAHGAVVDLGKGPVLAIRHPEKRGAFFLMPYLACHAALGQMRTDRSEDYDFLDDMQDFVVSKSGIDGKYVRMLKSFADLQHERLLGRFATLMGQYVQETSKRIAEAKRLYVRPPMDVKRRLDRFNALEVFEPPVQESNPASPGKKATMIELADAIYAIFVKEPRLPLVNLTARLQGLFKNNKLSEKYIPDLVDIAYKRHPDLYGIRRVSPVSEVLETIRIAITENPKISNDELTGKLQEVHPNNSFFKVQYVCLLVSMAYDKYPGLKELRKSAKASTEQLVEAAYSIMLPDPGMERRAVAVKLKERHPDNSISVGYVGNILAQVFEKHPEFRAIRERALEAKKSIVGADDSSTIFEPQR